MWRMQHGMGLRNKSRRGLHSLKVPLAMRNGVYINCMVGHRDAQLARGCMGRARKQTRLQKTCTLRPRSVDQHILRCVSIANRASIADHRCSNTAALVCACASRLHETTRVFASARRDRCQEHRPMHLTSPFPWLALQTRCANGNATPAGTDPTQTGAKHTARPLQATSSSGRGR